LKSTSEKAAGCIKNCILRRPVTKIGKAFP